MGRGLRRLDLQELSPALEDDNLLGTVELDDGEGVLFCRLTKDGEALELTGRR